MTVKKLPPGTDFAWTDRDHFVHGEGWYRLVEIKNRGRLKGEMFWIDQDTNELIRSTVLTEAGLAEGRPGELEHKTIRQEQAERLQRVAQQEALAAAAPGAERQIEKGGT